MHVAIIHPTDRLLETAAITRFNLFVPKQLNDETKPLVARLCHFGYYTILDNGVFEGQALSLEDLFDLAIETNANEIVLPDAFQDAPTSLELLREALIELEHMSDTRNLNFMVVPQGKNVVEWLTNYQDMKALAQYYEAKMRKYNQFTYGVPKWLGREDPTVRPQLLEYFYKTNRSERFHLLGCNSTRELDLIVGKRYQRTASPRSMDTSYPIKVAIDGYALLNDFHYDTVWESDKYLQKTLNTEQENLATNNTIHFLRRAGFTQYITLDAL